MLLHLAILEVLNKLREQFTRNISSLESEVAAWLQTSGLRQSQISLQNSAKLICQALAMLRLQARKKMRTRSERIRRLKGSQATAWSTVGPLDPLWQTHPTPCPTSLKMESCGFWEEGSDKIPFCDAAPKAVGGLAKSRAYTEPLDQDQDLFWVHQSRVTSEQ
jgi:hypothetical protein